MCVFFLARSLIPKRRYKFTINFFLFFVYNSIRPSVCDGSLFCVANIARSLGLDSARCAQSRELNMLPRKNGFLMLEKGRPFFHLRLKAWVGRRCVNRVCENVGRFKNGSFKNGMIG